MNEFSTVTNDKKKKKRESDFIQTPIKRCLPKVFWKDLWLNEIFAPIIQPSVFFSVCNAGYF